MASKKTPSTLSILVTQGHALRVEIDALRAKLLKVETELVALGVGSYADEAGKRAVVVSGSEAKAGEVSYVVRDEDAEKVRALGGESMYDLFERKVVWTPKDAFKARVETALTPGKARSLLAICHRVGKATDAKPAYVRWL